MATFQEILFKHLGQFVIADCHENQAQIADTVCIAFSRKIKIRSSLDSRQELMQYVSPLAQKYKTS
jgi:hypothetical protein